MKYVWMWVLLFAAVAAGQTTTANLGLTIPAHGTQCVNPTGANYNAICWDIPFANDLQMIDDFLSGVRTLPALKTVTMQITSLSDGCMKIASQIVASTGSPCPTFTFSGTHTGNIVSYDPANWAGGGITCRNSITGDLTTTGCSAGAGGTALLAPPGAQSFNIASTFSLGVNILEDFAFADTNAPSSSGGINETFTNTCRNSGKCHVFAGIGTIPACNVAIPSTGVLSGHGRTLTVLECSTAGAPVIASMGDNSMIEKLTVQHSSSPSTGGDGIVTAGDRITIRDLKSKNNWNNFRLGGVTFGELWAVISEQGNADCLNFDPSIGASGTMQWVIHGGLFQKCAGWAMNMTNATATNYTGPRILDGVHTFANHLGGIKIQNTSTGRISNVFIQNNVFSQNDGDNIFVDMKGRNLAIQGNYIEQSGGNVQASGTLGTGQPGYGFNSASGTGVPTGIGNGVNITSNCDPTNPPLVSSNRFWQTSDAGVTSACTGTQVKSNTFFDPGWSHTSGTAAARAGVSIQASDQVVEDNFFSQGGSASLSGIDLSNSADRPMLVGNKCGSGYTDATCVSTTTFPATGFKTQVGNTYIINQTNAPSLSAGQCTGINGSITTVENSTGGLYVCQNGAWVAH